MDNRLFDFSPVERKAIERVKEAYRFNKHIGMHDKLLLAFSGGKDSVCLYHVCELASQELGVDFDEAFYCQYNVTNIDPPELVRFIRNEYPKVHFHHPKITFWKLLEKKRMLPTQMVRFCCQELKEISHFEGGYTLTGVRKAESVKRSKRESFEALGKRKENKILLNDNGEDRRESEFCMQKRTYVCNPLIDWSESDVWNFIRDENLKYCKLYDEGFKRLGCIGCPMATRKERIHEFERWEGYKKQYLSCCDKLAQSYKANGDKGAKLFNDGQDMFDWWMRDPAYARRHPELAKEDNPLFDMDEDMDLV